MIKQTIGPCTLYNGDCLDVIPALDDEFDAVITDPPYCSGAGTLYGKSVTANAKYQQAGTRKTYPIFDGDSKDQTTWTLWIRTILSLAKKRAKQGCYFLTFIDWRQIQAAITAVQFADLSYRGLVVWDKTESSRAPHKGYFRQQAEFIVWASNGQPKIAKHSGPWSGVVRRRVDPAEKLHVTGKPIEVMEHLIQCVPPGGVVLDPFMGSASTAIACIRTGRRFVGIETSAEYYEIAARRIRAEVKKA